GRGAHAYSAAKAGVIGLTRSAAAELRRYGVRVNSVAPGLTVTPATVDLLESRMEESLGGSWPYPGGGTLGRHATPEDIAAAVCYLASNEADYVTGQTLCVDGGASTISGSSPFAVGDLAEPQAIFGPVEVG